MAVSLRELQQWMRWIIVDPRGVEPALQDPHPQNPSHPDRYLEPHVSAYHFIDGTGQINAAERLSIYAEGYFSRIVEALEENFATTKKILGDDLFLKLISDYLKEYPSRTTNICEIGRSLAKFVKTYASQKEKNYLYDIVHLEWNIVESFYANDLPSFNVNELSGISEAQWEFAQLRLDASVKLLQCDWPVDELWHNQRQEDFEKKFKNIKRVCVFLCLYRFDGDVIVERLSEFEFKVLHLVHTGYLLGEIAQQIDAENSDALMHLFSKWISCGIIKKINFKNRQKEK